MPAHSALFPGPSYQTCSLCFEPLTQLAIPQCGHSTVCCLCSLRLRWIMNDPTCPLCKEPSDTIDIVPASRQPPATAPTGTARPTIRGIRFHDSYTEATALSLLKYTCPTCPKLTFKTLSDLQTHLKRDHNNFYCELCLSYRQAFLIEQPLYDSDVALRQHEQGTHPQCDFCAKTYNAKFFTDDELRDHLRKAHFACTVCDTLNWKNEYYADYAALNVHFAEAHFPCPHEECVENRFVVFADEEGLRMHELEVHTQRRAAAFGRAERRQMLTIALQGGRAASAGVGGIAGAQNVLAKKKQPRPHVPAGEVGKINFRGPKRAGGGHLAGPTGGFSDMLEKRYIEDVTGEVYDAKKHKIIAEKAEKLKKHKAAEEGPEGPMKGKRGTEESSEDGVPLHRRPDAGSETLPKKLCDALWTLARIPVTDPVGTSDYCTANVRLQTLLEGLVGKSHTHVFKTFSRGFRDGQVPLKQYVEEFVNFVKSQDGKLTVNLIVELMRLCPKRRDLEDALNLKTGTKKTQVKPKQSDDDQVYRELNEAQVVGGGKLSFLNALHFVCSGTQEGVAGLEKEVERIGHKNRLVQMIGVLDAIQLETLAEMRNQLMTVNGRLSLVNVDGLIGLRPLFYRLMHVPEDRVQESRELMIYGWREFTKTAETIREKFSSEELFYIDLYVKIANMKLKSMGDRALVSGRHDFPSLADTAAQMRRAVPAADAFEAPLPGIIESSAVTSTTGRLWRRRGPEPAPVERDNFPDLAGAFGIVQTRQEPVPAPAQELRVKKRGQTVLLTNQVRRR